LRLGECQAALRQWDRSDQAFRRYLERVEDPPLWYEAQFGVGFALENRGRHDEAIEAYRLVLDRHEGPTAARAQFQIGECLYARKKYDEAARELLKVDILYAYPQWSAAALFEAGRCFEALGKLVEARAQYQTVVDKYRQTEWAGPAAERLKSVAKDAVPARAG
jgi:TolA-binding protein